ncbi:Multifunctional non-homologous end joining protein LigD [Nocardioides aquaticus]|uniref:Multifunctional non-homologous end joining protein LigD n=1 Tax=Nocardioides aquaticus TaxID=160826 RepID=A0ABX8EMT1_9ACTN|nr:ATP-dependent DNA ligase [Nocardioides aquaticus]QVT81220.1 Multifunctional non-homologous end joining protein LigD [Nocardioides aquaticus]
MSPRAGDPPREEVRVEVDGRTLTLSSLDKVMYPVTGFTKGEVLNYYAQVAPVMLPHLRDRAVTRIRWPHGVGGESFYEKNAPRGAPSWVRTVTVPTSGSRGASRHGDTLVFPVVDDLATLTWMANLAALELHVHQWRVGRNGRPRNADRLVVDLDPGEPAGLGECCRVALLVAEALAEHDLVVRPVLSGSKGLHLYADLPSRRPSEAVTALAKEVADDLAAAHPRLVTATMTKARRGGRCSWTGRRTPRRRPRSRRTRCAGGSGPGWPRRSPGTRSRPAPRTRWPWTSWAPRRCWPGSPSTATS